MKSVGHQPLSKELAARGVESGRLEIFQFCNPNDAHVMVTHNPIFAAYMPCRIALVEDSEGKVNGTQEKNSKGSEAKGEGGSR